MYLGTGIFKIYLPEWNGGELIFTSLAGDWATPLAFWIIRHDITWGWYDLASMATKVLEVYAAVLLFSPRWQKPLFVAGFFFHLSIALLLSIWQFMLMPLTYVLFVDPHRVAAWIRARRRVPVVHGPRPRARLDDGLKDGRETSKPKPSVSRELDIGHSLRRPDEVQGHRLAPIADP